jgi:phenylacetate-coenzyme A ligase PaaK-like adenylate-forming protein
MSDVARTTVDGLVAGRLQLSLPFSRKELEQVQMERLRQTVSHVMRNSPLYIKRLSGLKIESLLCRNDLEKIPFLTSEDIVESGHLLHCVSQSEVVRIITMHTSGSTGRPKRFSFTAADLEATLDFFHHGMRTLVDRSDRVLVLLPFEAEASVGDLLIRALTENGIYAAGLWPPPAPAHLVERISSNQISSVVGLPQQLLALSEHIEYGQLKTMLLCSDYAPLALRRRIEQNAGCATYLHYGATESGLGGAVECAVHKGLHIRESELLIEIVDPTTGKQLPDGVAGEVVLTTLGRQAMPLIRYRTGDIACLDRRPCKCGGVTARLTDIYGRLKSCVLAGGSPLYIQAIDDILFTVPGLLDYRLTLVNKGTDRIGVDYIAAEGAIDVGKQMKRLMQEIPEILRAIENGGLLLDAFQQVDSFAPTHTVKRTILDLR